MLQNNCQRGIESHLMEVCHELLRSIIVDPDITIFGVDVRSDLQPRFESGEAKLCFFVRIRTNDVSMVRGSARSYKGSYKERLEGALTFVAAAAQPGSVVMVDIEGEETSSVERLSSPSRLIAANRVSADSPLILTARRYNIPDILIRGRHIIAPSPAIAQFLENWKGRENCTRILDMFGGTGLATKVACTYPQAECIEFVDIDGEKIDRARQHIHDIRVRFIHADAFDLVLENGYDLVIADPYYEDVLRFVDKKASQIFRSVRCLLLVPGNIEDRHWNSRVCARLGEYGFAIQEHSAFGQVMLECFATRSDDDKTSDGKP